MSFSSAVECTKDSKEVCEEESDNKTIRSTDGASLEASSSSGQRTPTHTAQLCRVCGDKASGKHYGVPSCDGCRGFFKRSIRRNLDYVCKESSCCIVDLNRRNQCQACRFRKCLEVKMNRDAVQHERAPRSFPYRRSSSNSSPSCDVSSSPFSLTSLASRSSAFFPSATEIFMDRMSSLAMLHPRCNNSLQTPFMHGHVLQPVPLLSSRPDRLLNPLQNAGGSIIIGSSHTAFTPYRNNEDKTKPSSKHLPGAVSHPGALAFEASAMWSHYSPPTEAQSGWLLFTCVRWVRALPSYLQLPAADQISLLRNAWLELYALTYLTTLRSDPRETAFLMEKASSETRGFVAAMAKLIEHRLDPTEVSLLRAVALFRPDVRGLEEKALVETFQDQAQLVLAEHTQSNKLRFGKLLLLLPTLRSLNSDILAGHFFKTSNKPVEVLLSEMSHM